ncbi:MAG: T9SS type A sorting domain-containing protein [Ignavibacteria bacterium]|nr:T9SS type A sorting domain-containing protein [Ignavibacteria bacterium]
MFDRITVNAFPNPFTSDFTLEVLSDRSEPVFISIYNSSAQLLYNKNYFTSKGANYFKVNNKFSNGGIYFVRFDFIDRKEFKVLKLVKQ